MHISPAAVVLTLCLVAGEDARAQISGPPPTTANFAASGAQFAGMNVDTARHYCQMPPAIPFPPGMVETYEAKAREHFAADPTFDADFAKGAATRWVEQFYKMTAASNPALAEQGRHESCDRLIKQMRIDNQKP